MVIIQDGLKTSRVSELRLLMVFFFFLLEKDEAVRRMQSCNPST